MSYARNGNDYPRVNLAWCSESVGYFGQSAPVWILTSLLHIVLALPIWVLCNPHVYHVVIPAILSGQPITPDPNPNPFSYLEVSALLVPISSFFLAGWFAMGNKVVRGDVATFGDFFSGSRYYGKFLVYNIVFLLATNFGVLACLIGSFVAWGLLWPGFAALADGYDVSSALAASWEAMSKDTANATILALLVAFFTLLGLFCCGLGVFLSGPLTAIVGCLAYRDMIDDGQIGSADEESWKL